VLRVEGEVTRLYRCLSCIFFGKSKKRKASCALKTKDFIFSFGQVGLPVRSSNVVEVKGALRNR
jgi:hypothetical protein